MYVSSGANDRSVRPTSKLRFDCRRFNRMRFPELVDSLADAWRQLQPRHGIHPERRSELARQAADCLQYLTREHSRWESGGPSPALTRALRRCERLARAIDEGTALPDSRELPAVSHSTVTVASGAVSVSSLPNGDGLVQIEGALSGGLVLALDEIARIRTRGGSLLVDARGMRGHNDFIAALIALWTGGNGGRHAGRIVVVVRRGMQFVRVTRALTSAPTVGWLITHDREAAVRWLASGSQNAPN